MKQELEVIMDLMKDLQEKMEYGEEDFSERLGRKKPALEVAKISVGAEPKMEEDMEDEESDMDGSEFEEEEGPEEKLKNRLLKLRA